MSKPAGKTFSEEAAYLLMKNPTLYDLVRIVLKIPEEQRDEAIEKLLQLVEEIKAGKHRPAKR